MGQLSNIFNKLMALRQMRCQMSAKLAGCVGAPEQKISSFQADRAGTFASRLRSAYGFR
jgi:hypothetical protein